MKESLLRFNLFFVAICFITGISGCDLVPQDDPDDREKLEVEAIQAQVILDQQDLSMRLGDSVQLDYQIIPDTVEITDLEWTSSDASVATISENGLIIALGIGHTEIKVSSEKEKAHDIVSVTVIPTILEEIYLEAEVIPAYINEPLVLNVTFQPEDATDKTLTWETSDNSIVQIDQEGTITAKKTGYAWVSAHQLEYAYDFAVIVPASRGQLLAASQINISTGEQKHFINVHVAALEKQVVIKEVKLYLGSKGDPNSSELKTVNSSLSLDSGKGGKIEIEVNPEEANLLTFGRYVRVEASVGNEEYYVYISWFNAIEIVKK